LKFNRLQSPGSERVPAIFSWAPFRDPLGR